MRFISKNDIRDGLDYPSLVEALGEHHLRDIDDVQSMVLEQPGSSGEPTHFLTGPTWQTGQALGTKLVTVFPNNEHNGSGLPSVQAVYVLFDGKNGEPLACLDGTELTLWKTAADSALGAKYLAPPSPVRLVMVGAGAMAPHLIMAHCAVRPSIKEVRIWNRSAARAETLAASMAFSGVSITAIDDLEGAVREADIISCATMATEPLVHGAWLKPGTHLDLVGSYMPNMRECDDEALRRSSVFVDSPWSALKDSGELLQAFENGTLKPDDILANNFTLVRGGHPGRTDEAEITVYKNGGGGHLDLMVAQILWAMHST